jgi:outer membrane protein assembly factor BamB
VFVTCSYNKPVFYGIRLGGKGNVTESHIEWTLEKGAPHSPSPIVVGDEIYIVSDRGIGTCLDAKTGEQHWQERLGGNYSASPVYVGGLIYFQDEEGTTIIIEPGKELKEVARNTVEGRTLATFTPIDNGLLLRTDTHLYRIGK